MNTIVLPYPDIEIYAKGLDLAALRPWLEKHFQVLTEERRGKQTKLELMNDQQETVDATVVEAAVKPGPFTSIWFRSEKTPWPDDLSCARDAQAFLETEIRCSDGSWQPADQADAGGWLKVDAEGVQAISWG